MPETVFAAPPLTLAAASVAAICAPWQAVAMSCWPVVSAVWVFCNCAAVQAARKTIGRRKSLRMRCGLLFGFGEFPLGEDVGAVRGGDRGGGEQKREALRRGVRKSVERPLEIGREGDRGGRDGPGLRDGIHRCLRQKVQRFLRSSW